MDAVVAVEGRIWRDQRCINGMPDIPTGRGQMARIYDCHDGVTMGRAARRASSKQLLEATASVREDLMVVPAAGGT